MIIAITTILLAAAVAYASGNDANDVSKGLSTLVGSGRPLTLAASPGAPSQIRTSPASSLITEIDIAPCASIFCAMSDRRPNTSRSTPVSVSSSPEKE